MPLTLVLCVGSREDLFSLIKVLGTHLEELMTAVPHGSFGVVAMVFLSIDLGIWRSYRSSLCRCVCIQYDCLSGSRSEPFTKTRSVIVAEGTVSKMSRMPGMSRMSVCSLIPTGEGKANGVVSISER